MKWTRLLLVLVLALILAGGTAACAAASGYDPKRFSSADAGPPDPETVALAPAPKTSIPDPRLGPLPPPPPPPAPEDAGAPEAPRPLAAVMRDLEASMRKREFPQIASLLEDVASRSKDEKSWVGFATKGGELAKKEDVGGTRKQCDGCHATHRKTRKSP